jgi:hypothetical protein
MKYVFKFILLSFAVIIGYSCSNDETCRKNKYVSLQVSLYKASLNPTTNTFVTTVWSADSITVQGVGVDSVLYKNSKKISQVNLLLNKIVRKTKYQLNINKVKDTLTIYHTNITEFLSLECGCLKVYSIDSATVTKHSIDSIKVINHQVNTDNATNIRIFN